MKVAVAVFSGQGERPLRKEKKRGLCVKPGSHLYSSAVIGPTRIHQNGHTCRTGPRRIHHHLKFNRDKYLLRKRKSIHHHRRRRRRRRRRKKNRKKEKNWPATRTKEQNRITYRISYPKVDPQSWWHLFFFLELAFRVMFRRYRHRQFARRFEWLVLIGRSCQTSLVTAQVRALSVFPVEIGCNTRAEFEIVRPKRGRKTQFGNGFQSQLQGKKWK